ncbi:MAG: hypothetical protein QGG14_06370 [Planctomycetota bacterium]|nr:hypothetical protein [Planctomycetota bacterium]
MSGEIYPTWQQKVDAIKDACEWATGVCGDWKYKSRAFELPDDNDAWFTLAMGRIRELGVDETCYEDNGIDRPPNPGDPPLAGGEFPRSDVMVGQRQMFVELRTFNRDQEQDVVAWVVAERARTRLRMQYARDRWFIPNKVAISELFEVVPMPTPRQVVAGRPQSEAVLEMDFSTVVAESDGAAIGTWIEQVEVSSQLKNPGGVLLDPSIQLNEEVMP